MTFFMEGILYRLYDQARHWFSDYWFKPTRREMSCAKTPWHQFMNKTYIRMNLSLEVEDSVNFGSKFFSLPLTCIWVYILQIWIWGCAQTELCNFTRRLPHVQSLCSTFLVSMSIDSNDWNTNTHAFAETPLEFIILLIIGS